MGPCVEAMLTIRLNGCEPLNLMVPIPIYCKNISKKKKHLKSFFSSTKKALRLNLGIQHRGLKIYQICIKLSGMTFDLSLVWSNVCPSCSGNTGRVLYGICKYAIAVFIR